MRKTVRHWCRRVLEKTGQIDILHANAGIYVGGDLVDADNEGDRSNAEPER